VVKGVKDYHVWIEPEVHAAREALPGNVRQRIKRLLGSFGSEPRPSSSQALDVSGIDIPVDIEIRRFRLEKWRILYAVNESAGWVWVLRIRKRPPYDYEDLQELASRLHQE
jgi:mRNA-degrading endonuclease RelE of RelBE toxin-antitoxin system